MMLTPGPTMSGLMRGASPSVGPRLENGAR